MADLHGATLAQVILAVGAVYLHRLTGERDITLGMALAGRARTIRKIVGLASKVMPLRVHVDPDASFGAFL